MSTTFSNPGNYDEPAVFTAEGLIREARRQKGLPERSIPALCVLDPDGDILRHLRADGLAHREPYWPCYHTELWRFDTGFGEAGLVACAVGGPYAVLIAEQMFCCGCELLVSITSAGQVSPIADPPYFVLAEGALRDEGTSRHYLPPSRYVMLDAGHTQFAENAVRESGLHVERGLVWTTDAPFRETESAIAQARSENILAVEMETASLYAFAQKKRKPVVSFAHVTNQMGQVDGDFEKGEAWGSAASLRLIGAMAQAWRGRE
ncbi:MAG: nucleoside phosphorylase [Candidatus Hydrogenedentota bacterium]